MKPFILLFLLVPLFTKGAVGPVPASSLVHEYATTQNSNAMRPNIGEPKKLTLAKILGRKPSLKERVVFWLAKRKLFGKKMADPDKKTNFGLISLISGLAGVGMFILMSTGVVMFGGLGVFSLGAGLFISAIVFGILSLRGKKTDAKGIIGIILGGLGLLVYLIAIIAVAAWIAGISV